MFGITKKIISAILFISSVNSLKCILLENQECKVREVVANNEYMTYPYSIKANRCSGNCNNIRNPYSRVSIPDVIKILLQKYLI